MIEWRSSEAQSECVQGRRKPLNADPLDGESHCCVDPQAYLSAASLRASRNPGTDMLARDLEAPEP